MLRLRRSVADEGGHGRGVDVVGLENFVDPRHVGKRGAILGRHIVVLPCDNPLGEVHVVHGEFSTQDVLEGVREGAVATSWRSPAA